MKIRPFRKAFIPLGKGCEAGGWMDLKGTSVQVLKEREEGKEGEGGP